jgi:hypothetical protein
MYSGGAVGSTPPSNVTAYITVNAIKDSVILVEKGNVRNVFY